MYKSDIHSVRLIPYLFPIVSGSQLSIQQDQGFKVQASTPELKSSQILYKQQIQPRTANRELPARREGLCLDDRRSVIALISARRMCALEAPSLAVGEVKSRRRGLEVRG